MLFGSIITFHLLFIALTVMRTCMRLFFMCLEVAQCLEGFWSNLVPRDGWPAFATMSLHSWLAFNLQNSATVNEQPWCYIFGSALYLLWCTRNEEIFQALTPSSEEMLHHFWTFFHRNHILGLMKLWFKSHHGQLSFINWLAPNDPWFKCNSDGLVHASGSSACEGVLRDSTGLFIYAFAANVGHCPMVVAEFWEALYALEVAWSTGIYHLILEMDSLSADSLIRNPSDHRHPFASLISRIKHLLDRKCVLRVEHIYWEANWADDFMASIGHSLAHGLHVFCDNPESLHSVLVDEFRGVALPHVVS